MPKKSSDLPISKKNYEFSKHRLILPRLRKKSFVLQGLGRKKIE